MRGRVRRKKFLEPISKSISDAKIVIPASVYPATREESGIPVCTGMIERDSLMQKVICDKFWML